MERGVAKGVIPDKIIKATKRDWKTTLIKSLDLWAEIALSTGVLSDFKNKVKQQIIDHIYPKDDFKRFPIYFISVRPKTRFLTFVTVLSPNRKNLYLTFFEGFLPTIIRIKVESLASIMQVDCENGVQIAVDGKSLTCSDEKRSNIISIYDLLFRLKYKFRFQNEILYVGYSENPDDRPFKGTHEGLTQILYESFDRKRSDIFINYQQFHVSSFLSSDFGISFLGSNTMLDEIDPKTESKIIEASLIKYYIESRRKNYGREMSYLRNRIDEQLLENNIQGIEFDLDYTQSNSLFRFKDGRQRGCSSPRFGIRSIDGEILLTLFST